MTFSAIFALTAAAVAAIMDISTGKVKNQWICFLWIVGMVYQMILGQWQGIWCFMAGSMISILVLFPLFRFRMLGPGDIKLFSALGGVMGAGDILVCMAISFVCGGILSLVFLLLYGELVSRLRHFAVYIQFVISNRKIVPYYRKGQQWENLHFTIPVLMGVILYAGGVY
ncbi:MAG: prepilin peptidase [Lachnospiraceae bacterium]